METPKIGNLEIFSVSTTFSKDVDMDLVDIGSVFLECCKREYAFDPVSSTDIVNEEDGTITRVSLLEEDRETLTDCKYNLTEKDLRRNKGIHGTLYLGEYNDTEVKKIWLTLSEGIEIKLKREE